MKTPRLLLALSCLVMPLLGAEPEPESPNAVVDPALLEGLEYRSLGPSRGGRVTAVTGVPGQLHTFYMGTTGGGVWKTGNAGETWENVSDGDLRVGSIGAVAVAPSDPNVVYVGTGSACPRGNVSAGDGVWKSTDAGRSWTHVGLPEAGQIGRIRVHPDDPDRVWVAALGHVFGRNEERGVFRSRDGGASWEKVLYVDDGAGAVDLAMNPRNPRELYAAIWRVERKPWTLIDGGEESGLWKSTDGGDSWEELTGEGGLPPAEDAAGDDRLIGRIGVTVSPARPERVWALVTAPDDAGGLFRSDDAGETWSRISDDRRLQTRGWYYGHVYADPVDENTVYVMNVRFLRSVDGGRRFETVPTRHGDNHDLWIAPDHPDVMIEGNDGGAHVSLDGGESWSTLFNQPTAEFYRVTVDNQFPYRVYGAQQDNTTISVPSRNWGGLDPIQLWEEVGGAESGHIAVHPERPELTYAGNYIGQIDRYDRRTQYRRNVILYPELADGVAPKDLRYRFQWNAPILISPHDADVVYHASHRVHRTRDGGMSWETISPDLTRADPEKGELPGGPVQHDHTGVEVYGTVFALAESPHAAGELWAGTDDGRIQLTRDGGATWKEITPPRMPDEGTVNSIDLSTHEPGRAFVAVYRYRRDDFAPYAFATDDWGAHWRLLTSGENGIPGDHPVRVVREDPVRRGLLFAGTEFGLYVSFDDGAHWQPLQLELPATPITDLRIHEDDLVVATQGRSFWILDDLTPLRALDEAIAASDLHLFTPRPSVRASNSGGHFRGKGAPDPHPDGVLFTWLLAETPEEELVLEIRDASGELLRSLGSEPEEEEEEEEDEAGATSADDDEGDLLPTEPGLNRFVWDLKTEPLDLVPGAVMSLGYEEGAFVPPGRYTARLAAGERSVEQSFEVLPDPRVPEVTREDLEAQYALAGRVRARFDEAHAAVRRLRAVRDQLEGAVERAEAAGLDTEALGERAEALEEALTAVEEELIQTRNEAPQDPINFPPRLDNQLVYLWGHVVDSYGRPTEGARQRLADLEAELQPLLDRLNTLFETDLRAFNEALAELGAAGVLVPEA